MVGLENAGVAFLLVVIAGLATAVGAATVYFNRLVRAASKQVLAAGLAFSAGIMLYVSFIEIFAKAKGGFVDSGMEEGHAYMASTACTFGGMLFMRLLAVFVHRMEPDLAEECEPRWWDPEAGGVVPNEVTVFEPRGGGGGQLALEDSKDKDSCNTSDVKLLAMGLKTAAAIAIHNFPEGVAGFVAGLIDPSVGVTLMAAVTVHNIPEGVCIALPIFYATGSRTRGFLLALLSGLSEPVGALIAWAIIAGTGEDMHGVVYGVLFGMVTGVMVVTVLRDLLPTAVKHDPKDTVVTNSLIAGMLVMALSLVLFNA